MFECFATRTKQISFLLVGIWFAIKNHRKFTFSLRFFSEPTATGYGKPHDEYSPPETHGEYDNAQPSTAYGPPADHLHYRSKDVDDGQIYEAHDTGYGSTGNEYDHTIPEEYEVTGFGEPDAYAPGYGYTAVGSLEDYHENTEQGPYYGTPEPEETYITSHNDDNADPEPSRTYAESFHNYVERSPSFP